MKLRWRGKQDRPADGPAGRRLAPDRRPRRLARHRRPVARGPRTPLARPPRADRGLETLAESLGLPVLAYAAGDRLGGQGAGMAGGDRDDMADRRRAARLADGQRPRPCLLISGLVLTLQTALVLATGSVLLFPAPVPRGQPGPVRPVRRDRAHRQAAGGPAGRPRVVALRQTSARPPRAQTASSAG